MERKGGKGEKFFRINKFVLACEFISDLLDFILVKK